MKTGIEKPIFTTEGCIKKLCLEPNLKHWYKKECYCLPNLSFKMLPSQSTMKIRSHWFTKNSRKQLLFILCREWLKCGPRTGKMVITAFYFFHLFVWGGEHMYVICTFFPCMSTCVYIITTQHNYYIIKINYFSTTTKKPTYLFSKKSICSQKWVSWLLQLWRTVLCLK